MPNRATVPAPRTSRVGTAKPGRNKGISGHGHELVKCKYCDAVIRQCRCIGPKETVYETCAHCQKLIALGQPLYPASQPIKAFICGIVSMSGPKGEPLACAYPPGHDGDHSWATLPTFVVAGGKGGIVSLDLLNMPQVKELIQGAIESTDDTPRTARLRKALEAFGVE